jgi:ferredoxin-NADP reductase
VERLPDGEVSEYLAGELRRGDMLQLRGPIGGYFVWDARSAGPLLLVGGGSGIVPLMSVLRHRQASDVTDGARLLYSSRSWDVVIFRDELERLAATSNGPEVIHTLTRSQPPGWTGYARRVDGSMLAESAWEAASMPMTFVCGPTPFVESVAGGLVILAYPSNTVKTERFGPTGG